MPIYITYNCKIKESGRLGWWECLSFTVGDTNWETREKEEDQERRDAAVISRRIQYSQADDPRFIFWGEWDKNYKITVKTKFKGRLTDPSYGSGGLQMEVILRQGEKSKKYTRASMDVEPEVLVPIDVVSAWWQEHQSAPEPESQSAEESTQESEPVGVEQAAAGAAADAAAGAADAAAGADADAAADELLLEVWLFIMDIDAMRPVCFPSVATAGTKLEKILIYAKQSTRSSQKLRRASLSSWRRQSSRGKSLFIIQMVVPVAGVMLNLELNKRTKD